MRVRRERARAQGRATPGRSGPNGRRRVAERHGAGSRYMDRMRTAQNSCRAWMANVRAKEYERNKTAAEIVQEKTFRLNAYLAICGLAIYIMIWGGTAKALLVMKTSWPYEAYYCTVGFISAHVLILVGATAAIFPSSSPWSQCMSGLGAWQALLFILGTFHIDTIQFHQKAMYSLLSMVVCSSLTSIYWGYTAQDPQVLHLFSKLVIWVLCVVVRLVFLILSGLRWIICTGAGKARVVWTGWSRSSRYLYPLSSSSCT